MARRSKPSGTIRDSRQLDALASPARQEIIDTLEACGASSAAELGALLGRAPDSLYFHLRRLERVGLVARTERDIGRGRTEAVYGAAGRDLRLAHAMFEPAHRPALLRLLRAMLRITTRDVESALSTDAVSVRGRRCNFRASRQKSWLTGEQLQEMNEHIDAIMEIMRRGERPKGGALHALTIALTPVSPSERAADDDA